MRLDIGRITNSIGLHAILVDLLTDVTNIRTAITDTTAKLDADGDVVDTDYAANADPAALTTLVGDPKSEGTGV